MPPKRKISQNQSETADGASASNGSSEQTVEKKKPAPRRKLITKKAGAKNVDAAPAQVSDEAIRVRAYLIAKERVRRGLPGDENSDWLEARRQLTAELG